MSFYEDQEDDWFANDCKGSPSDYDGAGNYTPGFSSPVASPEIKPTKNITRPQKRNARRRRARKIIISEGTK